MLGKKSPKMEGRMRTLRVKLSNGKTKPLARGGRKKRSLSFTEWVDQYVKASQGNPV
jgi:hypothetical protein